jgi:hypothetical protein
MPTKIKLKNTLTTEQEKWLFDNVGARTHYLHNYRIGGIGWDIKPETRFTPSNIRYTSYLLTIEDEKLATFFILKFL